MPGLLLFGTTPAVAGTHSAMSWYFAAMLPPVTVPLKVASPTTWSFTDGVVVPIPMFPVDVMRIRSTANEEPASDKPGTAMRSEPMEINGRSFHQPGTIIGKALEPLESGEGTILVLLSLQ